VDRLIRRAAGVGVLAVTATACASAPRALPLPVATPVPAVTRSPAAPPRPTPPRLGPPFAVGIRTVTIVDPTRSTPARGPSGAHPARTLTTTVWYPIAGTVPLRRAFPLVVFAHGFDVTPDTYRLLLADIAADGYVVAAPLFPISGAGLPGPAREDDLPNQPADLSVVITAMLDAGRPGGWLAGAVNPALIGVVGHSDGAETVAAMLVVPADRDRRVSAYVVLAGQLPTWGTVAPFPTAVLVEQGRADTINPPWLSRSLFAALLRPKDYLDVLYGSHLEPVVGSSADAVAVRQTVIAFLDAALRPSPTAGLALRRWGDDPGVTLLTELPATG